MALNSLRSRLAQRNARVAARFGLPTKALEDAIQTFDYKDVLTLDDVIASRGG
jgi:hypothetical protein